MRGPVLPLLFISTATVTSFRTASWAPRIASPSVDFAKNLRRTCLGSGRAVAGGTFLDHRSMCGHTSFANSCRGALREGKVQFATGNGVHLCNGLLKPALMGRAALSALSRAAATRTDYDIEQMRLLDADECIIVDEGDNVLGHGSKKFCHLMDNISAGKALHRAFSVFLFNTEGKLLLQKRSAEKILFPNRWTNTCCSHPLYNSEEMDDPPSPDARGVRSATVRKLEHELGIPAGAVPADSMHYMTRIVYKAAVGEDDQWGEHECDYILVAVANVKCNINLNEVSEILYVSKDELPALLEKEARQEIMLSPWFKAVAQRWLPKWWDALLAGNLDSVKDTQTIHILS